MENKKEGIDPESIQSSTTPDPGYQWESGNVTIRHQHEEPIGQPFPSMKLEISLKMSKTGLIWKIDLKIKATILLLSNEE